ncbi:hypothetical protein [uncultured Piscinibacter sp.]|uniref:hypothetical protein n=1 Tax=uncultured Piscinibacter sp. TaxID=1131835 RepID=UPI002617750F|nr:hypothetical protein [uncultured Piscinibacter sp.]
MANNNSIDFRPSGSIDFEPVAIPAATAAAAPAAPADDKIDRDPLSINFGREKVHKPSATERMLAGTTIDWLIAFPMEARPKAMCEKYPHLANRVAREWADPAAAKRSLQELVADTRWGSTGFPAQVQGELERLLKRLG